MDWKVGCWGRPGSNSAKVAAHIAQRAVVDVVDFLAQPLAPMPGRLVIVTSNLGDSEVPEDVERFLVARGREIRQWVVIELGNYYGFDDWSYGARERIALHLDSLGVAGEALPGAGIDSLPHIDWPTLDRWCDEILLAEVTHVE